MSADAGENASALPLLAAFCRSERSLMSKQTVTRMLNGQSFSIETGRMAKQADGAVVVRMGETMVLVAVVAAHQRTDRDFFPLTVEYREKFYASGRIPGGFFKREGRPVERET